MGTKTRLLKSIEVILEFYTYLYFVIKSYRNL